MKICFGSEQSICRICDNAGKNRKRLQIVNVVLVIRIFFLLVQLVTPAGVEENMEIDAECSSSQARMECLSPGRSSSWVIP
jgi:hypothetical protein